MTVRLGSLCTFLGRVSNTLRTPSPTPEAGPALLGRGQPLLPCPPPASGNPEPTSPSQLPLRLVELLGPRPSSPQGGPTAAGWAGQRGLPPRAPLQGKGWSQCCGQCVALQVGRAGLGADPAQGAWGTGEPSSSGKCALVQGPSRSWEGRTVWLGQAQLDGTFMWAWSQRSNHIPCGWPPPLSCPDHGHVYAPCPQAGKQAHAVPALQPPPNSQERSPAPQPTARSPGHCGPILPAQHPHSHFCDFSIIPL